MYFITETEKQCNINHTNGANALLAYMCSLDELRECIYTGSKSGVLKFRRNYLKCV